MSRVQQPALVPLHNLRLVKMVYLLDRGCLLEKRAAHETIIGEISRNSPSLPILPPHHHKSPISKHARTLGISPVELLQSLSSKGRKHLSPLLLPKKRINQFQLLRSCIYRECLWQRAIQIMTRRSRRTSKSTICLHASKLPWVIDQRKVLQPINPPHPTPSHPPPLLNPSRSSLTSRNPKFLDHHLPPGAHILSNCLKIARTFPNYRTLSD
jgi:hypothetical protein